MTSREAPSTRGPERRDHRAIKVDGVSMTFGGGESPQRVLALQKISLEIARGEFVCLIGPSGCGKSTLLNIIGGLIRPTEGQVSVGGRHVRGPLPKDIAFVFQDYALFPWSTVIDNIRIGLEFQGAPRSEREERAWRALDTVGLEDFAHYYPQQLSGGMKQRVAVARALSLQTEILLMDEPFGALDEQTRMVLGEELSNLLAKTSKTIVFVTHSLSEAVFLADRVAVMTARPGNIKEVIEIDAGHPRKPEFMTSGRFHSYRDELYRLLRDEIIKTVDAVNRRVPAS